LSRARGGTLVQRTVAGVLSFIKDSVFSEEMAERRGLLQRLDPRAKLVAFAFAIGSVLYAKHLYILICLYLFFLLLASLSKIPLGFFVKRVWVFIPIFAGIIVLPILFSPASPGEPWVVLWRWGDGSPFAITDNGVWMASMLVLRVAASVSLAVLLVLTTRWAHILRALRVFGIPRIFVLTLEMAYRYVFMLIDIVQAEHLAKESRTIRPASLRADRQWVTSRIGHLFLKSRKTGEDVYLAMLSRGYSGEAKLLTPFKMQAGDIVSVLLSVSLLCLVFWLNRGT
jgi:cobalt/nickel transport system permease protein